MKIRERPMTTQTNMRLDPDTVRRLKELAAIMGPVKPLTTSDVVRECVRRVHEQEALGLPLKTSPVPKPKTKTKERRR